MELADDGVVFLDLHERLQVYIGNAGWLRIDGQQQVEVARIELGPADLPHALAHRRHAVNLAVVVAKFAIQVAFIRLADGG